MSQVAIIASQEDDLLATQSVVKDTFKDDDFKYSSTTDLDSFDFVIYVNPGEDISADDIEMSEELI